MTAVETEAVPTAEVVDTPPEGSSALATLPTMNADMMRRLADAGYPVLIENDILVLRAAFAQTQKSFAAILDPRDYLYMVSYKEGNKTRQFISKNRDEAEKFASPSNSEVMAKPITAGIVRLAGAPGAAEARNLHRLAVHQALRHVVHIRGN